jgi:hypothetical protein
LRQWVTIVIRQHWGMEALRLKEPALLFILGSAFLVLGCCSSSNNPGIERPGATSSSATFGDQLTLTGYSVRNKDGHTEIDLSWKAESKPPADYIVFVHAIDASGGIVFQLDHVLKNASGSPTSLWAAGDMVNDGLLATPPTGRAPGPYTLRLGIYVRPMTLIPVTQAGLPKPTDWWKMHAVLLTNIDCR